MAYISSLGNHYIENRWMPISYNTDLMAKAAAGMQKKFETNYMLSENIKSQYESINFLNTAADAQYKEKYSKVEEYFKGNPNIDYTDPLAIKNLMEVFKPLSQDTSLKSLYKREGEIKKQMSLIEEMKAKKDAGYNATNEAVFNADLNDYINSGDLKEASNKITQIKYTPYKDINEATKYCSDLLKGKESGSVTQYSDGVSLKERSISSTDRWRYDTCIQSSLNTPEYIPQLTVNNRYEVLTKGKEQFKKDLVSRHNSLIDLEIPAYENVLKAKNNYLELLLNAPDSNKEEIEATKKEMDSLNNSIKAFKQKKENFKITDENYLTEAIGLSIKEKSYQDSRFLESITTGQKTVGLTPEAQYQLKADANASKAGKGSSGSSVSPWGEGAIPNEEATFIENGEGKTIPDDTTTLNNQAVKIYSNSDAKEIFKKYYENPSELTKEEKKIIETNPEYQKTASELDNIRITRQGLQQAALKAYRENANIVFNELEKKLSTANNLAGLQTIQNLRKEFEAAKLGDPNVRQAMQNKVDAFLITNQELSNDFENPTTRTGQASKNLKKIVKNNNLKVFSPLWAQALSYIYDKPIKAVGNAFKDILDTNPLDATAFLTQYLTLAANETDDTKEFNKFKNLVKEGKYELTLYNKNNRIVNDKNIDSFTFNDYLDFKNGATSGSSNMGNNLGFNVNRSYESEKDKIKERSALYTSYGLPQLDPTLKTSLPSSENGTITKQKNWTFVDKGTDEGNTLTNFYLSNEGKALSDNYSIQREHIHSLKFEPASGLAKVVLKSDIKKDQRKKYADIVNEQLGEEGLTFTVKLTEPTFEKEKYSNYFNYKGAQTLGSRKTPFNSRLILDPNTNTQKLIGYEIKEGEDGLAKSYSIKVYSKTPGTSEEYSAQDIGGKTTTINNLSKEYINTFIQQSIDNPLGTYQTLLNTFK